MFIPSSAPISALLFVVSLLVALGASYWFTRRLENICDLLDLPDSLLSLFGALGANIPNYAASIVAIAHGRMAEGLGVIIGSNIYNVAIILAVSTFANSLHHSMRLGKRQARDARQVGIYTLVIVGSVFVSVALLSLLPDQRMGTHGFNELNPYMIGQGMGTHGFNELNSYMIADRFNVVRGFNELNPYAIAIMLVSLVMLGFFGLLCYHALHRTPHEPLAASAVVVKERRSAQVSSIRAFGGAALALLTALGSVVVMVNAGQDFAADVHMPSAILGLLVLAVATSLPNTVVAFILARTGRGTACIEEVFSSNSINVALGIALPLLIWRSTLHDTLLLTLDTPLMIGLTLLMLGCVLTRRVRHVMAVFLFVVYVAWIVTHLIL